MPILYQRLSGLWSFNRQITDFLSHEKLQAHGEAHFTPTSLEGVLLYQEQGKMVHSNGYHDFQQSYFYLINGEQKIEVYFSQYSPSGELVMGDYFHSINLEGKSDQFNHMCGQDHYLGHMQLISETAFELSWQVQGPRKNYQLWTQYLKG